MRRLGGRLLGDGFDEVADREVDGGFIVHGYRSVSRCSSGSPARSGSGASEEGVSQLFGGEGGFKRWRPDHSSDYENSSWEDAVEAGACGGVSGGPAVFVAEAGCGGGGGYSHFDGGQPGGVRGIRGAAVGEAAAGGLDGGTGGSGGGDGG